MRGVSPCGKTTHAYGDIWLVSCASLNGGKVITKNVIFWTF